MGGYDESKDKLLKLFEKDYEKGSLLVAVMQYDEGPAKLQLSRTYERKDGETGHAKAGRLTKDEVQFIVGNSEEILDLMS